MIPQRGRYLMPRGRLRFQRREPFVPAPFGPAAKQTLATMDLSKYDPDLVEFKRRAETDGVYVQIPRRGAVWREPAPLRFEGESLSDAIIRLRHAAA
jgi:hypothetical protein